ncbi:MAG: dienelactone hydrolase family protein [Chitinophagaceae bacterium]|nr:dienelactone hydrolase family protein [Chitinophagaceae bacterium]
MEFRFNDEVTVQAKDVLLQGELIVPLHANAVIIFSHGSGSSRLSSRNKMVARYLNEKKFGTLLFDLLTPAEEKIYDKRFDIALLTERLINATKWIEKHPAVKQCSLGYFGASTGAAATLNAAAALPQIAAVVSRGGRPDLAMEQLSKVEAAVLLIVGSYDFEVIKLNHTAFKQLHCERELEIVHGASHLFEEAGTMEKVCELAAGWFEKHLQPITV